MPVWSENIRQAVINNDLVALQRELLRIPLDKRIEALNEEGTDGMTPIMLFNIKDNALNVELLQALLLNGADIDIVSSTGNNLFSRITSQSEKKDFVKCIKVILQYIIDQNISVYKQSFLDLQSAINHEGFTPGLALLIFNWKQIATDYASKIAPYIALATLRSTIFPFKGEFKSDITQDALQNQLLTGLIDLFMHKTPEAAPLILDELLTYDIKRNLPSTDTSLYQDAYRSILANLFKLDADTMHKFKEAVLKHKQKYLSSTEHRAAYLHLLCHLNLSDEVKKALNNNADEICESIYSTYQKRELKDREVVRTDAAAYVALGLVNFGLWDRFANLIYTISEMEDNHFTEVLKLPNFHTALGLTLEKIKETLLSAESKANSENITVIYDSLAKLFIKSSLDEQMINKLATTMTALQLNAELPVYYAIDEHILLSPNLLKELLEDDSIHNKNVLIERLIAISDDSKYEAIRESIKEFLSVLLKVKPQMFFDRLKDESLDHTSQCKFIHENFEAVLQAYDSERYGDILYIKMQEYFTSRPKNYEKITYTQVIPYITSPAVLEKIVDYNLTAAPNADAVTVPRDNATTNPIILAAQQQNVAILLYMYNNREKQPWDVYWQRVGEESNTLLQFLIKMPLPQSEVSKELTTQIIRYALQIKSVVRHLDREKLLMEPVVQGVNVRDEQIYRILSANTTRNLATLDSMVNPVLHTRNSIQKWWKRYLDLQTILNRNAQKTTKLAAPLGSSNAHDNRVHAAAEEIARNDFKYLLDTRYPECNTRDEKIQNALIDARLLLLKSFIETKPNDEASIAIWQKIIDMSGMQQYHEQYTDSKKPNSFSIDALQTVSFANFKKIAIANKELMETIVAPTKGKDSALSTYFKELSNVNSTYLQRCSFAWNPYSPIPKKSYKTFSYQYALENDQLTKEFTLFTMLLATEDVARLINSIPDNDYEALLSFINNSDNESIDYKNLRSIIRKKILNIDINPAVDMPWIEIKNQVLKHALLEQESLCSSFAPSAYEAIREKSCTAGVYVRFSSAILSQYRKYYQTGLDSRTSKIQEIMSKIFKSKLEDKIVGILLTRLKPKQAKFSFMSGRSLNVPEKRTLNVAIQNILALPNKTLSELLGNISSINDSTTRQEIVNLLFPTLREVAVATDPIQLDQIIQHDEEIALLFDACFSVTTNNFSDLFSGTRQITRYTAHIKEHQQPTLSLEEFDLKTGRAAFLQTCFNSRFIANQVFKAMQEDDAIAKPLSKYELAVIKYYSVAIAEAATMEGIASEFKENLHKIWHLKQPESNTIKSEAVISNESTNISECKDIIATFMTLLTSPAPSEIEKIASMRYKQQLKDVLFKAVGAEYALSLLTENPEFVLDDNNYESILANTHDINLIESCKSLAAYLILPENSGLKKRVKEFRSLDEFIAEVAHYAKTKERDDICTACESISKAINLKSFYDADSWDAWQNTWDKHMADKKKDFDIL